jgi:hypothetical protein
VSCGARVRALAAQTTKGAASEGRGNASAALRSAPALHEPDYGIRKRERLRCFANQTKQVHSHPRQVDEYFGLARCLRLQIPRPLSDASAPQPQAVERYTGTEIGVPTVFTVVTRSPSEDRMYGVTVGKSVWLLALIWIAAAASAQEIPDSAEVRTSGSAVRTTRPDLATFTVQLAAMGATPREAFGNVAERAHAIRDALVGLGIPRG